MVTSKTGTVDRQQNWICEGWLRFLTIRLIKKGTGNEKNSKIQKETEIRSKAKLIQFILLKTKESNVITIIFLTDG